MKSKISSLSKSEDFKNLLNGKKFQILTQQFFLKKFHLKVISF